MKTPFAERVARWWRLSLGLQRRSVQYPPSSLASVRAAHAAEAAQASARDAKLSREELLAELDAPRPPGHVDFASSSVFADTLPAYHNPPKPKA